MLDELSSLIATGIEDVTLVMFAACNTLRIVAYVPQIYKAATDINGASAISRTTWSLFLVANLSTVAYALVNRSDPWLAVCFFVNAVCCVAIITASWRTARRHARRLNPVVQLARIEPMGPCGIQTPPRLNG